MKNSAIYYSVGALLYCPANNEKIADAIIGNRFSQPFSLALCLEDTINDRFLEDAEKKLYDSLRKIYWALSSQDFYLPKIFIRVRNPEQMKRLTLMFGSLIEIVAGFIAPKFSMENADAYIDGFMEVRHRVCASSGESGLSKGKGECVELKGNGGTAWNNLFFMPIYESSSIVDLRYRYDVLYGLKDKLDEIEPHVLNIRVGGNDLCHIFGFRRNASQSIHQIKPISQIFSDINTVYGRNYVISAPVWEYFNGEHWKEGLLNEIEGDMLCGFHGKTVIHPKQIAVVNEAYMVSEKDFKAAGDILNWEHGSNSLVSSDAEKERMNEYKTHFNWAGKIMYLAENFGVRK